MDFFSRNWLLNDITVQVKIPIQMDFWFLNEITVQAKIQI